MDAAPVADAGGGRDTGGGLAAAPGWLALAAAPVFTAMALWSAATTAGQPPVCMSGASGIDLGGMATMYALMAVFHASPWLKAIAGWRSCVRDCPGRPR